MVIQAIDPPPGYPVGQTASQIAACRDAGFAVEAYVYLWTSNPGGISAQLDLLQGLGVGRVWLDCEDTMAASAAARLSAIRSGVQQIQARGYEAGIYTAHWYWTAYLGNHTDFKDLPLWASIYDGSPDLASGFVPFGGWTEVAMKQYAGTSSLAGIGGIDLDAT